MWRRWFGARSGAAAAGGARREGRRGAVAPDAGHVRRIAGGMSRPGARCGAPPPVRAPPSWFGLQSHRARAARRCRPPCIGGQFLCGYQRRRQGIDAPSLQDAAAAEAVWRRLSGGLSGLQGRDAARAVSPSCVAETDVWLSQVVRRPRSAAASPIAGELGPLDTLTVAARQGPNNVHLIRRCEGAGLGSASLHGSQLL